MKRAVQAAGSQSALARICGVSRQAVSQWDQIPLDHVRVVSDATGLSRELLRPDVYAEKGGANRPSSAAKQRPQVS